jgi:hypothetical protein
MAFTITVAVPLHASSRWVDNVVHNVRALPAAVTEILVSDRTCLDDAAEQLRAQLADDRRVTVIAEPVDLGWEEHYQLLMEQATGDLLMWMPHDDVFDPSWVPTLATALETHPQAWLAFGRLEPVLVDGVTPRPGWRPRPRQSGVIAGRAALQMMLQGDMGVPFRGLFRRREVLGAGLRLQPAGTFPAVDMLWVFSVALRSALVFDDRTVTRKRYYPTSTHARWQGLPGDRQREALALLRRYGPGGLRGAAMRWPTQLDWTMIRVRRRLGQLRRRVRGVTP